MKQVIKMAHEVKVVKFGIRGGKKVIEHRKFSTQTEAFDFMSLIETKYNSNSYGTDYCDTSVMGW